MADSATPDVPGVLAEDGVWGKSVVAYGRESIGFGIGTERHGATGHGRDGADRDPGGVSVDDHVRDRPLTGFFHMGDSILTHDTWDRLGELKAPTLLMGASAFAIMMGLKTFTPRLLFSLARSCLRTLTPVLKPVSDSSEPSFNPSDRADSSSGLSRF